MNQDFECPWCKEIIQKSIYPNVQSFFLSFEEGTTSDVFGPCLSGYEIEDMCTQCALNLKQELEKLGIKITEIDV